MAIKICVVNLGTPVQTLMLTNLFTAIKSKEKDSFLTLIIDKNNKDLTKIIGDIDEFILFDRDQKEERHHEYVKKQLKNLISYPVDLVINTSSDKLSSAISSIIESTSFEGVMFDEYGKKWIDNPWFSYLDNLEQSSNFNLFHYTDIVSVACNYFCSLKQQSVCSYDSNTLIMIDIKKPEFILDSLPTNCFVLPRDTKDEAKTVALIKNCSLVLTSDYYISTLASSLGKKVVLISETDDYFTCGPYGDNNYVLKLKDRSSDFNGDILQFLRFLLFKEEKASLSLSNFNVFISRYDLDGFLEFIPFLKKDIDQKDLYKWVYKSVLKGTLARSIKAGDPQRFLSFGEKYIDRVVDIDREVEYLVSKVLSRYNSESIKLLVKDLSEFKIQATELKAKAFNGQKKAREFLNTVAMNSGDMVEIKKKKAEIIEIDDSIQIMMKDSRYNFWPIVNNFRQEKGDEHITNLFPMAKGVMTRYEELFSKASFLEEIIEGLWKRIN
ncbi:MAG: hypothetical protein WCQ47_06200 [bacterium]